MYTQGTNSIAIGNNAGKSNQGDYSIAIGYGAGNTNQLANSIVLNASGVILNTATQSAFYVNPIRVSTATTNVLVYSATSREITYNTSKTFVIDHPEDKDKYLVHACLEGPEAGVYYRGEGRIETDSYLTEITLPSYVKNIATNFTIQITPIGRNSSLYTSSRLDEDLGTFVVFGKPGEFFWHVHGKRCSIVVEPLKNQVSVKGTGPYKWI
jgi:hypothetical protein